MRRALLIAPLCLASMVVGMMLGRPVVGQPTKPEAAERGRVGRYQVAAVTRGVDGTAHVIAIDTMTGQCWSRRVGHADIWQDLGLPMVEANR